MSSTFLQLKTRIKEEIKGNKTSADDFMPFIGDAIISAIRMYDGTRFWFLEKRSSSVSLPANTESTALQADFKAMICVRALIDGFYKGADSGILVPKSYSEYLELASDTTARNYPGIYALLGDVLYAYPSYSTDLTLDVTYIKGDLDYDYGDNDTSVWFEEGLDMIRYRAMQIFYQDTLHSDENSTRYDELANSAFQKMRSRHNTRSYSNKLRD